MSGQGDLWASRGSWHHQQNCRGLPIELTSDERNIPPMGRAGEPEDMLASVFVENGEAKGDTYEPLLSYRLVTNNGVLTLPEDLDACLLNVLERVDQGERASS